MIAEVYIDSMETLEVLFFLLHLYIFVRFVYCVVIVWMLFWNFMKFPEVSAAKGGNGPVKISVGQVGVLLMLIDKNMQAIT